MLSVISEHGYLGGVVAFAICAALLPVIRATAVHLGVHDLPGHLKIHVVPVPRLGGIAIGFAILGSLMLSRISGSQQLLGICLALMVIWYVGLLDDLMNLSPGFRLAAQLTAGVLVSQTPWRLKLVGSPFVDVVLTCLFVAVFVNAFNFLDGADGLAGGVAGFIALGYAALYSSPALTVGGLVAWVLLGSCLGFLAFNFPPARIFMGDSGSTTLGFVVAFLALDFYRVHYHIGTRWLLPLVFAALPLLDFFLAVARRIQRRVSPMSGDRQHFYDLLLDRGWSSIQVAFGAYAVTGALLIVGWLCMDASWQVSLFVSLATIAVLFTLAVRLGAFRWGTTFLFTPTHPRLTSTIRSVCSLNRKREFEELLRRVAPAKEDSLLDIGSGDGYWTNEFARYAGRTVGLEPDPQALAMARQLYGRRITFQAGFAECLEFEDNSFDCIVSVSCFEHFRDAQKALDECYRVLRPGGRLAISVDSLVPQNSDREFRAWHSKKYFVKEYFAEERLASMLNHSGFRLSEEPATHLLNSQTSARIRELYLRNPKRWLPAFPILYSLVLFFDRNKPNMPGQVLVVTAIKPMTQGSNQRAKIDASRPLNATPSKPPVASVASN